MRIFTTLFLLFLFSHTYSQTYDTTQYYGKMKYVFHYVDKTPITTGLLRDYGIEFLDLDQYTGTTLADSNYVSIEEWRMLYSSLYSSQINSNSTMLKLDTVNRLLNKYNYTSMPISFIGLHYDYNKLKDNTLTNSLMTVSNDRLYDVPGRPASPYENKTLFALAPIRQAAVVGDNEFIFRPELFLSNTGRTISSIAYRTSVSSPYQNVTLNTPFIINYDTTGFFDIDIKVTYTDLSVFYGHSKIAVYDIPNGTSSRYGLRPIDNENITASRAYLGQLASGDITIDYALNNSTGQIRKPLIVIEGFDPNGTYNYNEFIRTINQDLNSGSLLTLNNGLDNLNEYDLIFLNWANGTDHIQRNAYLLQEVINNINGRKTTWNGVRQDNVIIGMSMGGLVTRYALRDMELNSIDHETRLFISHDVPHWGANVPVGAQAAVQHLAPWEIINVGGSFPDIQITWEDLFPDAVDAIAMFDSPAARQMLIQRYILGGETLLPENSMHTAFFNELNTMGWPLDCKNVNLSNGSCAGEKVFNDNSTIFTIDGNRPMTYFGGLWRNLVMSAVGGSQTLTTLITGFNNPQFNRWSMIMQFPLGLFSTKSSIGVDFKVRAVPSSGTQEIYRGDVYSKKRILWAIDVKNHFIKCHVNSTSGMLPLDNAPGGLYDINQFGIEASTIEDQLPEFFSGFVQASTLQPRFCFVPTVSALAVENPTTHLFSAICNNQDCLLPTDVANSYSPQQNELHISYTQDNSDWILQLQNPAVNCAKICPEDVSISGASSFCTTSGLYTIPSLPVGASVTWTASPSINVFINNPNDAQTTLTRFGVGGKITLTATVTNACGASVVLSYPNIQVGTPYENIAVTRYMGTQCVGSTNPPTPFVVSNPGGVSFSSVEIQVYSGGSVYNASNTSTPVTTATTPMFYLKASTSGGGMMIRVRIQGTCGWSDWKYISISGCSGGFRLAMSPNPSSGNVQISLPATEQKRVIREVVIVDKTGMTRKRFALKSAKGVVNISDLPSGTYVIRVFDGSEWISDKIIKY